MNPVVDDRQKLIHEVKTLEEVLSVSPLRPLVLGVRHGLNGLN
jgi:hypothetical protein